MSELSHTMLKSLDRVAAAKEAIMKYPHYTDEARQDWLDALDKSLEVQAQAHKNAQEALEEALLNHE
jgi:hypothetical protein